MSDRLVSPDDLHRFVPATRTGVVSSTQEHTDDGLILAERYTYPDSIPGRTSPPIEAHSVGIALTGTAQLERRLGGGSWEDMRGNSGMASLRPAGRTLTVRGRGQNLNILSVRFPPSLLQRIAAENKSDPTSIRFRDDAILEDPVLTRLGQAICRQMEAEGTLSAVVLTSIVESIVTRLFVAHCAKDHEVDARGPLSNETIEQVRDYIEAHLGDDIKVEDLAECAGMGVSHFTRLFKQTLGRPPYQYVLRQRVDAACRQLQNTNLPIARIALEVGFSSQSHLTRRFKKIVGTTPARYRAALQ